MIEWVVLPLALYALAALAYGVFAERILRIWRWSHMSDDEKVAWMVRQSVVAMNAYSAAMRESAISAQQASVSISALGRALQEAMRRSDVS